MIVYVTEYDYNIAVANNSVAEFYYSIEEMIKDVGEVPYIELEIQDPDAYINFIQVDYTDITIN
jgi:hypothetical protein|tara:strand:- start:721 stop:912 length:192 start_codon:yes stop_codon:yes gene_type:complete